MTSGGVRAGYNPPLQVVGYIATRTGEPERGPQIRMNGDEARLRMLLDGELVYVYGPRRHELATLLVDDQIARGGVVLRDVLGVTLTEIVRVVKVDTDRRPPRGNFA